MEGLIVVIGTHTEAYMLAADLEVTLVGLDPTAILAALDAEMDAAAVAQMRRAVVELPDPVEQEDSDPRDVRPWVAMKTAPRSARGRRR